MLLTQRLTYQRRKLSNNETANDFITLPLRAATTAVPRGTANLNSLKKLSTLILFASATALVVLSGTYYCSSVTSYRLRSLSNNMMSKKSTNKKDSSQGKSRLSPKRWRMFSYKDLHTFFECESVPRALPSDYTEEQWQGLRQYYKVFAELNKKIGRTYPLLSRYSQTSNDGNVAIKEKASEHQKLNTLFGLRKQQSTKHLYIKATRDIPVNTTISLASNNTIVFSNGRLFRKFVWGVYHEYHKAMACHSISGARVVQSLSMPTIVALPDENNGNATAVINRTGHDGPAIVLDLDASLLATVTSSSSSNKAIENDNVACIDDACRWKYITKRDVRKGEMLQASHGESKTGDALVDQWKLVGL